jgi:murein L,D-transpeptidase YcbB/YkuD
MKKLLISLLLFVSVAYGQNTNEKLARIRNLVTEAESQGLQKNWYLSQTTEDQINQMQASGQLTSLDALLNSIADRLAKDLYLGRVTPDKVTTVAKIEVKKFPYSAVVNQFLNTEISSSQLLTQIQPKNSLYLKSKNILNHLLAVKALGDWTLKPAGLSVVRAQLNVNNPRLVQYLRLKLNDFGYANDTSQTIFNEELKSIVQLFQADHNLEADGVVGAISWSFLERSLDQLIMQARLNIDRMRWLPDDITANYIFVNLAQQRLQLFENSVKTMDFKTINGRTERATPMLVDRLKSVVLNPTWTVPNSLLRRDKAPILQNDPSYLARNHMVLKDNLTDAEVDPSTVDWTEAGVEYKYTIVQSPGPWNALGFIKFPLSNPYAIYLHDTNERHLFQNDLRLRSSGCVRLSEPFELAEKVLNDPKWTVESMRNFTEFSAVQAVNSTYLNRKTSLPVYLFYQTIFSEDDGRIITLNDHYGIDELTYSLIAK